MPVSETNRWRYRALLVSRDVKALLFGMPERFAKRALGRWFVGPLLRWLFLAPDGRPHRAGEIILADMRRSSGLDRATIFDPDPAAMAYREGRRAQALEFFNYLHLDEGAVQKLMEVDDGLE